MSNKELGKLPWIGISPLSSLHKLTSELWREMNISPKKVAEVDHIPCITSLVRAGVGLAIMREDEALVMQQAGDVVLVGDYSKTTELHFIYSAERAGDPIIEALLTELDAMWHA
jgi:DNA-binding transcriptional LysR family regulator